MLSGHPSHQPSHPHQPLSSGTRLRARSFLLLLCLTLGGTSQAFAAPSAGEVPLELAYTVRVERPTTHLVGIEIMARKVEYTLSDLRPAGVGARAVRDL